MKKSFLYVVPAALILALLFAGCPQDSDDDDDSGGGKPVNTPGSDLSYIAYAFGYGVDTVQVVNDIYLESYELVIPAGKTLDFRTNGKSIRGITDESKIIALGTLILDDNQAPLNLAATPGAKIIADSDFIRKYVVVDYTYAEPGSAVTEWTPADWTRAGITDLPSADENDTSVKIFATWKQIVLIDTFENFRNYGKEGKKGYSFIDGISNVPRYVAINAPQEEINGDDVETINARAGGLRFYLVGEPVKINFNGLDHTLNLALNQYDSQYYTTWAPVPEPTPGPAPVPESVFYTGGPSNAASLTIAGSVYISSGKINAPGGLTVWGIVNNTGVTAESTVITDKNTPFTAWTAFLYGASFGGPVNLPGSIANTFGGQATFDGELQIAGPVTFQKGTFNGEALFGNAVQFISSGSDDKIVFADKVIFGGDVQLYENVTFSNGGTYYKNITGVSFDKIEDANLSAGGGDASYKISGDTVTAPKSGSFSVDVVVPGENVTVTEDVKFEKNATFEGNVTFTGKPTFGTVSFADAAKSAGSQTTTVINGLATFEKGADFGGTLDVEGTGLKPVGNVVILEEAKFTAVNADSVFTNITNLKLGNSESPAVVFTAGTEAYVSGSGAITIPSGGGIEFKDKTLTFTGAGGTLGAAVALNNATVKLDSTTAKMVFSQGGNSIEVMRAAGTGGGFDIIGNAELDAGKITGKGNGVAVKASGDIILTVPGGPSANVPVNFAVITVNNALVDLSSGGTIVFAGTASRFILRQNANIKLHDEDNGLAIPKGQTVSEAVITAGNSGGSAALVIGVAGGTEIAAGAGWAGTRAGGTYGAITESWTAPWSNTLDRTNSFLLVGTEAAAGSISAYTGPGEQTEGPVAVFTSQGSF